MGNDATDDLGENGGVYIVLFGLLAIIVLALNFYINAIKTPLVVLATRSDSSILVKTMYFAQHYCALLIAGCLVALVFYFGSYVLQQVVFDMLGG